MNSWNKTQFTSLEKITVIKSILLPKLTNLSITLPSHSKQWIARLVKLSFNIYLEWKNDTVSRILLIKKMQMGDSKWFRRILQSTDDLLNTHFGVITKSTVLKILQMRSDNPRIIF